MDIDDTQESRLMARGIPSDDPAWGQVSAFLTTVESTYPNVGAVPLEASHLAAISRELRLLQAEPRPAQRKTMNDFLKLKTHRVLLGSLIAALVALTAGVGVAAAMGGGDPLKQLVPASQPEVAPTPAGSQTAPAVESTEPTESEEAQDHSATADDEQEQPVQSGQHESEEANDDSDDQKADDSDSDEADDDSDSDEADSDSDEASEHAQPSNASDDDSDDADDDSQGDSDSSDQSGDQSVDDEPGEH